MRTSYSCEGEDILVAKLFERYFPDLLHGGTYVDVGAFHPHINSNTALFHDELRWRGVCIDPRPGCMEAFKIARPWDVLIEGAVGEAYPYMAYDSYSRPELNRVRPRSEAPIETIRGAYLVGSTEVKCRELSFWLEDRVTAVDFLSVDVEGAELEVLKSLDWEEHRPAIICAEVLGAPWDISERWEQRHMPVIPFLQEMDYVLHSRLHCSTIFVDSTRAQVR